MNLERLLTVSAVAVGAAGLLSLNLLIADEARQGDGTLAQEPMHLGATVPPNFVMAIDDSGSMTFQTMFPGTDGEACWSNGSFFDASKNLNTSGSCDYFYVVPGPRVNDYYGIPPFDAYGFARSPDFNPTYYNPDVKYDPWIRSDTLQPYADAAIDNTLVDPRDDERVTLFSPYYSDSSDEDFRIQTGMVIPAGTEYGRYESRQVCTKYDWRGNCTNSQTQNYWTTEATTSDYRWPNSARNISIKYKPGVFYLKTERALAGYTAPVEITDACGSGCSMYKYEPNTDETKRNFANWFSFYGNRNRAMVAGLTRSLAEVENMRVGYFTINSGGSTHAYANVSMHDLAKDDDNHTAKKALLAQVIPLGAMGGTPNRYAVNHIGTQFKNNSSIIQHACQKNAGMLFTDGYSNDGGPSAANNDQGMGTPFSDGYSNTMADIVTAYYNTPLRTDFPLGRVPVSDAKICSGTDADAKKGVDCNTNLHMNFYGITLGARGKEFGVRFGVTADGKRDGALATRQALEGPLVPVWEARTDNSPNTVDEIWHATMNTRGQYINAQTPADITTAMRNVLASVGVGGGVSGSLAITGSRLGDGSLSVTPRFNRNGTDWYGDVLASKPVQTRNADGKVSFSYASLWAASEKLPSASSRKIYYGTNAESGTKPTVQNFYSAGPDELADLCVNYPAGSCGPSAGANISALGVTATQAVEYLAGDRSHEGAELRVRTHPLGDIVNSTPIVSAPTDDHGYALIRKSDTNFEYDPYDYNDYLDAKANRKRMVYVGANDGMLHAFNGDTGVEEFAYVPAAVVGYMGNLLFPKSPQFQHRYLVDGPVIVSDARIGTSWKTVLVGTAGAGARSVFGLNVTTATDFTANDVLWEVNDRVVGDVGNRIGYVLGKPVIVPVRGSGGTPVWKAIFGGGYANRLQESAETRGTVTLFVVDMATGAVEYIDAKEAGSSAINGLGNVVAIDRFQYSSTANGYINGSDGMVDTVYAGDLQGNVWKFNLNESGSDRVAFGGEPLFRATDGTDAAVRQAITGGLEAAVGPRGGVMVLFGTGSFSYTGDKMNSDVQTAYGVLDMPTETTHPLTRANLQAQTLDKAGLVSNVAVDYFGQRGWYLDLGVTDGTFIAAGERMVGYPKIEGGTLYFTTYAPAEGDACSGGGSNYLYGLSTLSGGGNLGIVKVGSPDAESLGEGTGRLTLETDGSAPVKDVSVFTTGKQGGLSGTPDDDAIAKYNNLPDEYCMAIVSVAGSQPLYRVRPCGRQSWRQIR